MKKQFCSNFKDVIAKGFEKYKNVRGREILEALKKFEFNDEAEKFEKACLEKVYQYLEEKGELTDEEFLALLIRLCMMYFVEVGLGKNLWYLILLAMLPKEIQQAKLSEIVRRMEEEFIKYMEAMAKLRGDEGVRDAVLVFLFLENADFICSVFEVAEKIALERNKILN